MYKGEKVNVIMPAYMEGKTVYNIIKRVLRQKYVDKLIIVYDESKDNTLEAIKRACKGSGRTEIVYSDKKLGKGHALRLGLEHVEDGIIIIQDADEEYYPEDYGTLLSKLTDTNPVFGKRKQNLGHTYIFGNFARSLHTFLFNLLYHQSVADIQTCYKVFKLKMINKYQLKEDGWEIEPEIAIALANNGYKIINAPIRYKGRTFAEGKKIGPKAAISEIFYIIGKKFK